MTAARQKVAKQISAAIDPTNPKTRNFAVSVAAAVPGNFSVGQICLLWQRVSDDFKYVEDPHRFEYVSPASQTIEAGLVGDCDDVAVLMAAIVEAVAGTARVVTAYAFLGAHAYAECYIGKADYVSSVILPNLRHYYPAIERIYCHVDAVGGHWLNLDSLARRKHPGDFLFDARDEYGVYPDGWIETITDGYT